MRSVCAILAFLLFNLFTPVRADVQETDLLNPAYGWRSPNPETRIVLSGSKLTLSATRSSTGIYNRIPLRLPARDIDLLMIRMKTSKAGISEVSWRTGKMPFSRSRSFSFYLRSPGRYHTYYLNLRPYLAGKSIDQILFFPFDQEGKAELTSFKFIKGNIWQKALAGWQEFWGPTGRSYTGRDFFILKSPMLFGKPIFYYLNWLIALSLLASLLLKRPQFTIILILSLWILLEASSAVNNWIFFKDDLRFWGKSLEEKKAMQNVRDFYPFMKHAQQKIPAEASFALLADPKYPFSRERAGYYLYPRPQKEKADYLLVFDLEPAQEVLKDYRLFSRFRKGAYIFKWR